MPNKTSYADLVRELERLLQAFNDNQGTMAPAAPQRDTLEIALNDLKDMKSRQDSFAAQRQEATQQVEALMLQAREEARRLRGMAKGLLGTRNERLVQFQVAPIRSRPRLKPEPTAPPTVEAPAPEM